MSDQKPQDDDAALHARLAKLREGLRAVEARQAADNAPGPASEKSSFGRAMSVGLNVFSEFAAAVVVGGLIGWQADVWLGTKPWLLVIFLGLGTAAGFWNIYRLAARQASKGDDS